MSNSPPTLAQQIVQFQEDVSLVHQFTTGQPDAVVSTPNGEFPTLAGLVRAAHDRIRDVKTRHVETRSVEYDFTNTDTVVILHNLGTKFFVLSVFDTDGTPHIPGISNITEDGFTINFTYALSGTVTVFLHQALVDVVEQQEHHHHQFVDECLPD